MTFKLYDTLGIDKSASIEDIKKAYKKLAIQYHPDKGGDQEKFKEITNAYKILSDPKERDKYDNLGDMYFENGLNNMSDNFPFENMDMFNQIFGNSFFNMGFQNNNKTIRKCNDYIHNIEISNRDSYFGIEKHLTININKKCFICIDTCNLCNGKGNIQDIKNNGFFRQMVLRQCNKCNGLGSISITNKNCNNCKGNGNYSLDKKLDIKIPRGSQSYTTTFDGMGEQPQTPNDIPGNLVINIVVKDDPIFIRKNLDLIYNVDITFLESITGKDIKIPHYDGDINFKTSKLGLINPNIEYRFKNKGMIKQGNDSRESTIPEKNGDLILKFKIIYPSKHLETTKYYIDSNCKIDNSEGIIEILKELGIKSC